MGGGRGGSRWYDIEEQQRYPALASMSSRRSPRLAHLSIATLVALQLTAAVLANIFFLAAVRCRVAEDEIVEEGPSRFVVEGARRVRVVGHRQDCRGTLQSCSCG